MRKGIPAFIRSMPSGLVGQFATAGESGGAPAPIVCLFPLDADTTETTDPATGFEGKLTPSLDNQTGSYTVQSGLAAPEDYGMLPVNSLSGTGLKLDISTGITTAALTTVAAPALTNTGGGAPILLNLVFANPATFAVVGTIQIRCGITSRTVWDVAGDASLGDCANNQVAISFDAGTGNVTISFTDDLGAPQSAVVTTYDPGSVPQVVPLITIGEAGAVAVDNLGLVFSIRFETAADQITAPVPAGARDACGNLI